MVLGVFIADWNEVKEIFTWGMEVRKNALLLISSVQQPVIVATDAALTCGVGRHRNVYRSHQSRDHFSAWNNGR